jgi:hypothetical protein
MIAAAGLLIWVGAVLTPDDISTIDGLEGLLFRYVPVGPFTWIGGAVFASLGVRMVFKAIRAETTLRLTSTGVVLPGGAEAAWHQIVGAQASRKDDLLTLEVDLPEGRRSVRLSAFDLGASPQEVAAELARQRSRLEPPAPPHPQP